MHQMLSLSHDSVFQSPHSGSSEMELDAAQSSSSLSISQPFDQKLKVILYSLRFIFMFLNVAAMYSTDL